MWGMYVFLLLPLTCILAAVLSIPAYIAQAKKHPYRRQIWIICIGSAVAFAVGAQSPSLMFLSYFLFAPIAALVWVLIPVKKSK